MALDLKPELEISLRDENNEVWTTAELDDLLEYAIEQTNIVRPRVVRDTIPLVTDQDNYDLTNVHSVTRVDMIDSDSKLVRIVPPSVWEVWGDNDSPSQILYLAPSWSNASYSLRVHGYGPYDFTTNTPPRLVQTVILALARAEALRRLNSDRARFRQWAQSNPRGDISTNELLQSVNEADAEANRLLRGIKLIRRPILGRL